MNEPISNFSALSISMNCSWRYNSKESRNGLKTTQTVAVNNLPCALMFGGYMDSSIPGSGYITGWANSLFYFSYSENSLKIENRIILKAYKEGASYEDGLNSVDMECGVEDDGSYVSETPFRFYLSEVTGIR